MLRSAGPRRNLAKSRGVGHLHKLVYRTPQWVLYSLVPCVGFLHVEHYRALEKTDSPSSNT